MSQADRDLGPYFARMRDEEPIERTPEEEAALEARIVARIDDVVANEPVPQPTHSAARPAVPARVRLLTRPPAARVAMWLAAACLPLIAYAAFRARLPEPTAQIGRDPMANGAPNVELPRHSLVASPPDPSPDLALDPSQAPTPSALPARATPSAPASPIPGPTGLVSKPLTAPRGQDDALGTGPEGTSGSTLSAENRLFEEGTRAEREGNVEGALTALDRLSRDFPRSPLAQNAMVRKFHLLARANRSAEAVDAARAYLAAYPQGFAQREADEIIRGAKPSDAPLPKRE